MPIAAILSFFTSKTGIGLILAVLVLGAFGVQEARIEAAQHGEVKAKAEAVEAQANLKACSDRTKALADASAKATAQTTSAIKAAQPAVRKAQQGAQKLSVFVPTGTDQCERLEGAVGAVREALR